MKEYVLGINTILHTKDGSKIGNAIVTDKYGRYWTVTTDYGNKYSFTRDEIDELFNIAWLDYTIEEDGFTCAELQKKMSANHKHRV